MATRSTEDRTLQELCKCGLRRFKTRLAGSHALVHTAADVHQNQGDASAHRLCVATLRDREKDQFLDCRDKPSACRAGLFGGRLMFSGDPGVDNIELHSAGFEVEGSQLSRRTLSAKSSFPACANETLLPKPAISKAIASEIKRRISPITSPSAKQISAQCARPECHQNHAIPAKKQQSCLSLVVDTAPAQRSLASGCRAKEPSILPKQNCVPPSDSSIRYEDVDFWAIAAAAQILTLAADYIRIAPAESPTPYGCDQTSTERARLRY